MAITERRRIIANPARRKRNAGRKMSAKQAAIFGRTPAIRARAKASLKRKRANGTHRIDRSRGAIPARSSVSRWQTRREERQEATWQLQNVNAEIEAGLKRSVVGAVIRLGSQIIVVVRSGGSSPSSAPAFNPGYRVHRRSAESGNGFGIYRNHHECGVRAGGGARLEDRARS